MQCYPEKTRSPGKKVCKGKSITFHEQDVVKGNYAMENRKNCVKQRNYVLLLQKSKRELFGSLNETDLSDDKKSWGVVMPFFFFFLFFFFINVQSYNI